MTTKDAEETRNGMADGTVDIVVGTHALLAKSTKFNNLGLLIIDEEQHFGVGHKERLKAAAHRYSRAHVDRDADPADLAVEPVWRA